MAIAATPMSVLALVVHTNDGRKTAVSVTVREAYNFGYAARDHACASKHVERMRALGLPAPGRIPAIFPIPPDRVSTASTLTVSGDQTYGEVEFALIKTAELGWVVTIASDHTDLEVERVTMPKAKGLCPNVIGQVAWPLADVADRWDSCVLRMWGLRDGVWLLLQQDVTGDLTAPIELIRILEERRQGGVPDGTVILSGTIAGGPTPGINLWSAELEDTQTGRRLTLQYELRPLPEEL